MFKAVGWAQLVHIDPYPHPAITHPKAIEAVFMTHNSIIALNMICELIGYALRLWSVNCLTKHGLSPKEHRLWLKKSQILYGVESASLALGYTRNLQIGGELL